MSISRIVTMVGNKHQPTISRVSMMARAASHDNPGHGDMGDQAAISHLNHVDVRVAEALGVERAEEREAELRRDVAAGICKDCGQPIAPNRLLAKPYATRCVRCQGIYTGELDEKGDPVGKLRRRK